MLSGRELVTSASYYRKPIRDFIEADTMEQKMTMLSPKPESKDSISGCRVPNKNTTRSCSQISDHQTSTSRASILAMGSTRSWTLNHKTRNNINGDGCNKLSASTSMSYSNISDQQTATSRASLTLATSLNFKRDRNKINDNGNTNKSNSFLDKTTRSYSNMHNHQTSTSKLSFEVPGPSKTLRHLPHECTFHKHVIFGRLSPEKIASTKLNESSGDEGVNNTTGKHRGFRGFPVIQSSRKPRDGNKQGLLRGKYASHIVPNTSPSTPPTKLGFLLNSNILNGEPGRQHNVKHRSRSLTTTTFRGYSSACMPDNVSSRLSSTQGRESSISRTGQIRKWIWINNENMAGKVTKRNPNRNISRELVDVHTIGVPKTGCIKLVGMPPDVCETFPLSARKNVPIQRSQQNNPSELFKPAASPYSQPGILIRNKTVLKLIRSGEKAPEDELENPVKGHVDGVPRLHTTIGELLHSQFILHLISCGEEESNVIREPRSSVCRSPLYSISAGTPFYYSRINTVPSL